jgi:putative toxin-antitoxin system antitoxin component (TIGR02293 family)
VSHTEVIEMLGGPAVLGAQVKTEFELIAAIRRGLPVDALDAVSRHLAAAAVLQREIFGLVGNVRTLQRKREKTVSSTRRKKPPKGQSLSPDQSDRLTRLARMIVRAEEVLGTTEKAHHWLTAANRALGGARPLTLLDSDAGALAVDRVLGRLEHGVFS